MLRRAAATATLNGRAAAWHRPLTRSRPVTLPLAHLVRHHPQAQLHRPRSALVSAPPLPLPHPCGARGYSYRRMARRIPIARPDGYSSSDGEAEEPDAGEAWEITEPGGGAGAKGDDDSEGSEEVEGFMLDFTNLRGSGDGDEEATEEGGKQGKGRAPCARRNARKAPRLF